MEQMVSTSRWNSAFRSLTALCRMKRHLGYFRALYGFIPLFFSARRLRHEKSFSSLFVQRWFVFPPQPFGWSRFTGHARRFSLRSGARLVWWESQESYENRFSLFPTFFLSLCCLFFFFVIIIVIASYICCDIKTLKFLISMSYNSMHYLITLFYHHF